MNLFELFVKIGAKDEASGAISKITKGLGKGLATAAKIGTAAVGAAAAGIAKLTGEAIKNYAEYEQLVGGVETLFKDNADAVLKYAQGAYASAGISANEYMTTVTSFSAALLQSLGGDTKIAAQMADMAIRDMSDNANKMGTSMELIQNAYQGFAKGNYTMLDNLKLGYGGTKEEMARLLADAEKISGFKYDISSYSDIVRAIHVVQTQMGITGTTAREAGTTIQGSVNAMKAAWTNLVTGFADKNADIEELINNLVTTIVGDGTESNLGVIGNVLPAIETALGGVAKLIEGAAPKIVEILPELVTQIVPALIEAATGMVNAVVAVLPDLLNTVVTALINNAPALIEAAIGLVKSLVKGIQDNYKILIDSAVLIVNQIISGFLSMMPEILTLGMELLMSLITGITEMLSDQQFIQSIVDVVLEMVDILTKPETITNLLNAALSLILALGKGLILALPQLLAKVPEIIGNLVKAFGDFLKPVIDIGKNIIEGIKKGISDAWNNLVNWFKNLFNDIIGIAKKILGIASPSKVFKKIGAFTAEGFGDGFAKAFGDVEKDIEDSLDYSGMTFGVNAYGTHKANPTSNVTSFGTVNINIDGAEVQDEEALAEMIEERLIFMTERRGAVFA